MKVYIFFTEAYRFFIDDWFMPSFKHHNPSLTINVNEYPQICETALLNIDGLVEKMHYKIDTVIRGIEENMDDIIIYSDIDIQFFGDILPDIQKSLGDNDVVFQKGDRSICMGFLACHCNENTLTFFKKVKELITEKGMPIEFCTKQLMNLPPQLNDEKMDGPRKYKNSWIKWDYLPANRFINGKQVAASTAKGKFKSVPKETLMHHATYTTFKYKTKQLQYVKHQMEKYINIE